MFPAKGQDPSLSQFPPSEHRAKPRHLGPARHPQAWSPLRALLRGNPGTAVGGMTVAVPCPPPILPSLPSQVPSCIPGQKSGSRGALVGTPASQEQSSQCSSELGARLGTRLFLILALTPLDQPSGFRPVPGLADPGAAGPAPIRQAGVLTAPFLPLFGTPKPPK